MSTTNEEKQKLLTALEKAIFSGHSRVKNGDKEIEYKSLEEMIRARDTLKKELGIVSKQSGRILPTFSKGL